MPRNRPAHTALAAGLAFAAAACASSSPTAPTAVAPQAAPVPIMGAARLTPERLVAWFSARQPSTGSFAATVPVTTLARYFVDEGTAEGVSGDIAFVQSVVETGWFRFSGVVRASANNFAGIGATDTNPSPATFPDAQTGVRAQIQHLRAYGDPTALTCTVPPLATRASIRAFSSSRRKARRRHGTRWATATGRPRQHTRAAFSVSTLTH